MFMLMLESKEAFLIVSIIHKMIGIYIADIVLYMGAMITYNLLHCIWLKAA